MAVDSEDPRLGDHFKTSSLEKLGPAENSNDIVIVQYADDEGVRLNHGRPGAKAGPKAILKYFQRMVHRPSDTPRIFLLKHTTKKVPLMTRHELAEAQALKIFKFGYRLITLGGGHDYGFPDASAYFQATRGTILNIDAHLDMRPVLNSKMNSGTAFFRFIERFGGKNLIAWGIQKQCNAVSHLNWAKSNGATVLTEQHQLPPMSSPTGLSVCLDAFTGIRGVSAPAMAGLTTSQGVQAVKVLAPRSRWLGLYECAPRYDPINDDSARYAALLAYHFIHHSERSE